MSKPAYDSINKHLHYDRLIFTDQVMPKGELTLEPLCHACWYYLMLAQKNKEQVGKGPESQIITVDTWSSEKPLCHAQRYKEISKRVTTIYGCHSPEAQQEERGVGKG